MTNVHALANPWPAANGLILGEVVLLTQTGCRVRTDQGLLSAELAASCLLQPGLGDRVALLVDGARFYLTAVLIAHDSGSQRVQVPGELVIAAASMHFDSTESLSVQTRSLELNAAAAQFQFGRFRQLALKMTVIAEKLDVTAEKIHRSAKQEFTLFHQQFERILDSKNTQADRWFQRVHKQWVARSERTTITAKKEVKIDGERIDLG